MSFDSSPVFDPYSRVVINVPDGASYVAGDSTGRTLTLECPWGTQRMADNLLLQVRGYAYQPFTATGALVSPAVELGDGISVNGVRSRIFSQDITFGTMFSSDIAAPESEEIDHEYPYFSSQSRKVQRQISNVRSNQADQANELGNKLDQVGGDAGTFGWTANATSWLLSAVNRIVFMANESGLQIDASGIFSGTTYAGKIQHGDGYGSLTGAALTDATVTYAKLAKDVTDLIGLLQGVSRETTTVTTEDGQTKTINYLAWKE